MIFSEPKKYVYAEYKPHFHPIYRGNPLVEALKPQYSEEEFHEYMTYYNELPDDLWEMEFPEVQVIIKELEYAYISDRLDFNLYSHIYNEMICGYRHRNPFSKEYNKMLFELGRAARTSQNFVPNPHEFKAAASGSCTLLSGLSGIGKTEKIRGILRMFPQVIRHESYDEKVLTLDQLTYLSFDISSARSVKALVMNFFAAVDEALGTENVSKWQNSRASTGAYIVEMQVIAARHSVGIIHIDECQKLLAEAKSDDSPTVKHLESMFNQIGVPMILTTTHEGLTLFNTEHQSDDVCKAKLKTSRRLTSSRFIQAEPMVCDEEPFKKVISVFLPDYLFTNTEVLSDVFLEQVFNMTMGVHQLTSRLLRLFLENVHRYQPEPGEYLEMLESLYQQQFKLVIPAINAIRNGDAQTYESEMRDIDLTQAQITKKRKYRTLHSSVQAPKMATEQEIYNTEGGA